MKLIKKLWILVFSIACLFSFINVGYSGLSTPWGNKTISVSSGDYKPEIDDAEIKDINEWWETFTSKLNWILHLPRKDDYTKSLWYVTTLIQIIINWLLWILAFVALVYMLYCGFLVLSSWSDDKNTAKGKKWISTAAIALAWIGLSWLIISAMIRFINWIANK